mmetsp:Transcript_20803/g.64672  ORF Transcript_20803/g.64672 Transcript_20803/m.64672 type:complete len:372 (-) Transcript_20803:169-1284(-)
MLGMYCSGGRGLAPVPDSLGCRGATPVSLLSASIHAPCKTKVRRHMQNATGLSASVVESGPSRTAAEPFGKKNAMGEGNGAAAVLLRRGTRVLRLTVLSVAARRRRFRKPWQRGDGSPPVHAVRVVLVPLPRRHRGRRRGEGELAGAVGGRGGARGVSVERQHERIGDQGRQEGRVRRWEHVTRRHVAARVGIGVAGGVSVIVDRLRVRQRVHELALRSVVAHALLHEVRAHAQRPALHLERPRRQALTGRDALRRHGFVRERHLQHPEGGRQPLPGGRGGAGDVVGVAAVGVEALRLRRVGVHIIARVATIARAVAGVRFAQVQRQFRTFAIAVAVSRGNVFGGCGGGRRARKVHDPLRRDEQHDLRIGA